MAPRNVLSWSSAVNTQQLPHLPARNKAATRRGPIAGRVAKLPLYSPWINGNSQQRRESLCEVSVRPSTPPRAHHSNWQAPTDEAFARHLSVMHRLATNPIISRRAARLFYSDKATRKIILASPRTQLWPLRDPSPTLYSLRY